MQIFIISCSSSIFLLLIFTIFIALGTKYKTRLVFYIMKRTRAPGLLPLFYSLFSLCIFLFLSFHYSKLFSVLVSITSISSICSLLPASLNVDDYREYFFIYPGSTISNLCNNISDNFSNREARFYSEIHGRILVVTGISPDPRVSPE